MTSGHHMMAIALTWIVLALIAQIEKKWVPIFPGSNEEPPDYKEVPVPYEDEEYEE